MIIAAPTPTHAPATLTIDLPTPHPDAALPDLLNPADTIPIAKGLGATLTIPPTWARVIRLSGQP